MVGENEEFGQPGLAEPFRRLGPADEDVAEDGDGDRDDAVHEEEEEVEEDDQHAEGAGLGAVGLFIIWFIKVLT